ncbi:anthranilate synthase component I [Geobacillus sp. G4]|uniref:Anthranilate synthase component 1 n=2 Tax=Geobacillus TaxID=129337 RepID=Q5KXU7_GEOKA|nr:MULTISPECIES: anthranilate synthase component I [Geobacillus]AGE22804.1 anthranilate synthase component I [Geobacillus sp. GHH01]MCG6794991.1 anthranilate synthase component I [Geobacillus sp. YHL]OQP12270.1 anthranilate synthase component I [Geobacillus thermoleovorans]OQP16849.1 anthranilate synthase component I [Geobacillus zalihae]OQP25179.1 anthranilate synthase component I [Geobacillus zalihae]
MSADGLAAFLTEANEFRTIPIVRKFVADVIEPLGVFANLREEAVFLLESKDDESPWARYSFIGVAPFLTLESETGETFSVKDENGNEQITAPTLKEAFQWVERTLAVKPLAETVPFTGGAVGFLGYDFISAIEKVPRHKNRDVPMKTAYFVFCESLFAFDQKKRELLVIHYIRLSGNETEEEKIEAYRAAERRMADLAAKAARPQAEQPLLPAESESGRTASFAKAVSNYDKKQFLRDVEAVKRYIAAGDVFQAVLSQRFCVPVQAGGFAIYRLLRYINPSPYMFYFQLDGVEIVGSSPEKLIQVHRRRVEIDPIAGTRRRGRSPEEDERLADELYHDPKERAEHYMLVDLARNDIGRVAKYGTVEVPVLLQIGKFSHVMHLISKVVGELDDNVHPIDALLAAFPAGTVSGAPKVRAMQILQELEPTARGLYAGAIAYIGFDGNIDSCIAIRTAVVKDGYAYVQAGAGIVADSVPELEWKETRNKASALMNAIEQAERLFAKGERAVC